MIARNEADLRQIMLGDYLPVAFVGSGLSSNYMDWFSFLESLAQKADDKKGIEMLKGRGRKFLDLDSLLLIADESLPKLPKNDPEDFMRETFLPGVNKQIPSVYNAIVNAPFEFYLTTNYDTNIEDAYKANRGKELEVVLTPEIHKVLRHIREREPFVLKIHGCARRGGRFVIGNEDYHDIIYRNPHVRYVLMSIFATRPIVFMGYGYRDPHISRYLEYERSVLPPGGMRRFTFVKKNELPYYIETRLRRMNVTTVPLDEWTQIESILHQIAFVRVYDHYQRSRIEFRREYDDFINNARKETAWGALMYSYASSDMGLADDVRKVWEIVEKNSIAREYIEENPALNLVYRIIVGQMLKRKKLKEAAAREFKLAAQLARQESIAIRTLRSIAFRYSGIFWLGEGDFAKAEELFERADGVLENEFPFDALDVQKWKALLIGIQNRRKEASDLLTQTAIRAETIGYLKNAAWCRFDAIDQLQEGGLLKTRSAIEDAINQLGKPIELFRKLDHMRGLGEVYYLLAKLKSLKEDAKEIAVKEEIHQHLRSARAMADLSADKRLSDKSDELLNQIDNM